MLCPCERLEQQQGKMQSDKMCPVTLGIHKTKTSLLAGTLGSLQHQQASSKGCRGEAHAKHSNSSRIRAHATQNAVRQNAFRYLRNPYKTKTSLLASTLGSRQHQQASKECHGGAHAKHSNSSRLRAHAKQNAVQQNAPRYLWNPLEPIKTRMQAHRRQKLWISSRIQAKRMPKNSFTSPLEPIKNNKKQCFGTVPKHPNWSGSETPEH